jgi:hypothetical protein
MTGGQDPVDAKLVSAFELVNGDQTLPMLAMINSTALTMDSAIEVAAAGEVANSIKAVEITVRGNATTAPRVGTYTGDFVVLFEPRLDTGENPPAPIAS